MVVIRLSRHGTTKKPFYQIVVADRRKSRDGRYIERIGYFNPRARGSDIRLSMDKTRIAHWVGHGAQPSERVLKLIEEFDKGLTAPQEVKAKKHKKSKKAKA